MPLQLSIDYQNTHVVYDVITQEDQVYQLHLIGNNHPNGEYLPQKIILRKKGNIWVSDMDNNSELFKALTAEVIKISGEPDGS